MRAVHLLVTASARGTSSPPVAAGGLWAVIDATVEATLASEIPHAELIAGPNTYTPSDRFPFHTLGGGLAPGIVQRGAWVFEIPAPLLEADATQFVVLRAWVGDGRLDSRLAVRIGLDDPRVSRLDVVALDRPTEVGT